jgi:hypothetical protein
MTPTTCTLTMISNHKHKILRTQYLVIYRPANRWQVRVDWTLK